jgi:hypothetical protein
MWMDNKKISTCLIIISFFSGTFSFAQESSVYSGIHVGVSSCAGSTCHGSSEPLDVTPVLQNEFVTWYRKDKHAKAYNVLLSEQSRRIAKNLGLEAAHTAEICLDCHADNVPESQRGRRFQISDGITCEVCHGGGAQGWLGLHITGRVSHEENLRAGLYPLEDPQKRAELCLSCHLGDQNHEINHKIMGAGHPRLSFELDTFTMIQPAHYQIDKDYRERKTVTGSVKTWAIGQVQTVVQLLNNMKDTGLRGQGMFPELIFFDCHACHHPMTQARWQSRKSNGLQPGIIRLGDANLLIVRNIAKAIDSTFYEKINKSLLDLHIASAMGIDAILEVVDELMVLINQFQKNIADLQFSNDDINKILDAILKDALTGELTDYAAAEQTIMALDSILSAQSESGNLNTRDTNSVIVALDKIYESLKDETEYSPDNFIHAVESLTELLSL